MHRPLPTGRKPHPRSTIMTLQATPQHRAVWFEIPTTDLTRAMTFYSTVFEADFHVVKDMGPMTMAVFNHEDGEVSGCLLHGEHAVPSATGSVVYFNGGDDLATPLGRIEQAGGTIITPKTLIAPEIGYYAVFKDSEGNTVGLHSLH
jgi:predicted enzyme related to lactoylglutathione lyase